MRKRIGVVIVCLFLMAIVLACSGVQTVKPYELGKVTAETLLFDARIAQNQGKITADQFDQVRKVYDQLKVAQDTAINARKAVIMVNNPATQNKAQEALNQVLAISMQLVNLAQSLGMKVGGQ